MVFDEGALSHLLDLREKVKKKDMLTIFQHPLIGEYEMKNA